MPPRGLKPIVNFRMVDTAAPKRESEALFETVMDDDFSDAEDVDVDTVCCSSISPSSLTSSCFHHILIPLTAFITFASILIDTTA